MPAGSPRPLTQPWPQSETGTATCVATLPAASLRSRRGDAGSCALVRLGDDRNAIPVAMLEQLLDRIQGKAPPGARRSGQWRRVRAEHLARQSECVVCGRTRRLTAHHVIPFHIAPDLELEPANLITLCEGWGALNCHLIFGHLGRWPSVNETVRSDAAAWRIRFGC